MSMLQTFRDGPRRHDVAVKAFGVLTVLWVLFCVSLFAGAAWVAMHFIVKYW